MINGYKTSNMHQENGDDRQRVSLQTAADAGPAQVRERSRRSRAEHDCQQLSDVANVAGRRLRRLSEARQHRPHSSSNSL